MQSSHPRQTTTLYGHQKNLTRVVRSFDNGKLPHALLLSGPKGIGKATFAYYFARFLLSQSNEQSLAFDLGKERFQSTELKCDERVASQVAAKAHVDLLVMEKGFNPKTGKERQEITVDEARKLKHFLSLTAVSSSWRVAIIDAVDEMNRNGANAILKALEEPPKQTLLILISHTHKLRFETIRSRCQNHLFQPLLMKDFVKAVPVGEGDLSSDELELLFYLSDGSPGMGESIICNDGIALFQEFVNLLGRAPNIDYPRLHGLSDELCARGAEEKFDLAMKYASKWLFTAIRGKFAPEMSNSFMGQNISSSSKLISTKKLDDWVYLWEETNRLCKQVKNINLDRKQVFLSTFSAIGNLLEG